MSDRRSEINLEKAARIVLDDAANLAALRKAAWRCFDAGRFDCAQHGFERLVAAGQFADNDATALHQIYADHGDTASIIALINRYLDHPEGDLTPSRRFAWAISLFDAVAAEPATPECAWACIRLLEAAASADDQAWSVALEPKRRAAIESALRDPETALIALEQFAYAPVGTGLPGEARVRIEEIGCRYDANRDISRSAERLLHALGEPEAAYRVEACRRAFERAEIAAGTDTAVVARQRLGRLVVTIAGGHAALRSLARRDLSAGVVAETREIPSAWEASRDRRAVQAVVAGSDLIVVIARQVAHATSDQVRKTAARLGVPVAQAETASVAAIRRAVERFAGEVVR